MALKRGEATRLSFRSLFLQVLLNYRTMQGAGFLYALWPWLRKSKASPEQIKAAANYLNAHPVMASLAVGALRRRLEAGDADRDPSGFAEWQNSLCGPLGVAGDSLIWDRWKPIVFSAGVLLLLWWPSFEVWLGVALVTLLAYNVPLFALRLWGVREGYRLGGQALEALDQPLFSHLRRALTLLGVVLSGLLLAAGLARTGAGSPQSGTQFLLAFAVAFLGTRLRWTIAWILLAAMGAALLLPAAARLVGLSEPQRFFM